MKNHGTTSQVTGSYAELQKAVLVALPRDIDPDVALSWTRNGDALARALRKALVSPPSATRKKLCLYSFNSVIVFYEMRLEDAVNTGSFDVVNPDITSEHFPSERKGTGGAIVEILRSRCEITQSEVLHEIYSGGYRPSEIHELIAMRDRMRNRFPIVALGSVWRNSQGNSFVPCLTANGSERALALLPLPPESTFPKHFCFTVVRKTPQGEQEKCTNR